MLRLLTLALLLLTTLAPMKSAALDNEPLNPLPTASSSYTTYRTYLQNETADIMSRFYPDGWVAAGGQHASSVSCTSAAFSTEAFTSAGNRVTADSAGGSVAINYSAVGCNCTTDIAWVIISGQAGNSLGNFTRAAGSNYFVNCAESSQPTLPADSTWLMQTLIASNALTTPVNISTPAPGGPPSPNSHSQPSVYRETQAFWHDAAQPYVVPNSGCTHSTSGSTSTSITACSAYVKDGTLFHHVKETLAQTITYSDGDGNYWLILHRTLADPVSGWTRIDGTHYLWKKSTLHPTIPSSSILIMSATVSAGAITAADSTLPPTNPFIYDNTQYISQHGGICDGVTDISGAYFAAYDALPSTGGRIVFPASRFSCKFTESLTILTKPVIFSGAGGAGTAKGQTPAATTLEHSGSDTCSIEISGAGTRGSVLENFELNHTGTAAHGICIGVGNANVIRGISMNFPTVKFSVSGIRVGDTATSTHSHVIDDNFISNSAPVGIETRRTIATQITNNTINHHSAHNILLGSTNSSKETYVLGNRLENNFAGQTAAWSMHWRNVEGGVFKFNHFEIGEGADGIAHIDSTDFKCENCIFENNQVNMLNTTVQGDGLFFIDAPGGNPAAYIYIKNNRIEDNRDTPPTTYVVELGNTSGNGGASIISILDNEITSTLSLVNDPALIKIMYDHNNNWDLGTLRDGKNRNLCIQFTGVGNTTTGEDNLMPACTVLNNRIRTDGVGLAMVFAGEFSAANENKQLRIYIDGTEVWDTGVFNLTTDIAWGWRVECTAVRATGTGLRTWCQGNKMIELPIITGETSAHTHSIAATQFEALITTYTPVSSLDGIFTEPFDIQVTGEATTTNAIRQFYQYVELVQQ